MTVGGQSGAISPVGALSPGGEDVASGGVSQEARILDCCEKFGRHPVEIECSETL